MGRYQVVSTNIGHMASKCALLELTREYLLTIPAVQQY